MSNTPVADQTQVTASDVTCLKDLGDIVRARNIFFVPFFGAFLAFLIAKSQYIIDASILIQIEAFVTFSLGVYYSSVVSNFLWTLDVLRFHHGIRLNPRLCPSLRLPTDQSSAMSALFATVGPSIGHEDRLFRWTMRSLWLSTGTVLLDIFFGNAFLLAFESNRITTCVVDRPYHNAVLRTLNQPVSVWGYAPVFDGQLSNIR
jgi:hypothetical protein